MVIYIFIPSLLVDTSSVPCWNRNEDGRGVQSIPKGDHTSQSGRFAKKALASTNAYRGGVLVERRCAISLSVMKEGVISTATPCRPVDLIWSNARPSAGALTFCRPGQFSLSKPPGRPTLTTHVLPAMAC